MKNEIKATRQGWLKMFILSLLLLPAVSGFSGSNLSKPMSCPIENLTKTGQSSGNISYSWSAVSGATEYKVWYTRSNDNYTSSVYTTSATYISFSSLPAGNYRFYFAAVCGQETLDYIIDDVIML